LIGTKIPRLDGLAKASGRAKYPSDIRPEGTLFAVMLYSPHAHAKIKSIDASAAEKMPGVKAVSLIAKEGTTLRYQGDDIAAAAAETEEQARDAIRAIKVEYEVLPHVVTEAQAMADDAPKVFQQGNVRKGRAQTKGKPEEAMGKADVIIEGTYSLPVITHVCLEPHGLTAKWEGSDKLTVWASTQAVQVVAGELADSFNIPTANVTVLTDFMGGGFGSKFGADVWGRTAAELARKSGRPVKLFLDRIQEHLAAGNRPSASAKVKLGATKEGKVVALIAETHGTGGSRGGSMFPLPYVYFDPTPNTPPSSRTHSEVPAQESHSRRLPHPDLRG
jgi:xanthine dehydrogenase YagR molybdenum-binding subunit